MISVGGHEYSRPISLHRSFSFYSILLHALTESIIKSSPPKFPNSRNLHPNSASEHQYPKATSMVCECWYSSGTPCPPTPTIPILLVARKRATTAREKMQPLLVRSLIIFCSIWRCEFGRSGRYFYVAMTHEFLLLTIVFFWWKVIPMFDSKHVVRWRWRRQRQRQR